MRERIREAHYATVRAESRTAVQEVGVDRRAYEFSSAEKLGRAAVATVAVGNAYFFGV